MKAHLRLQGWVQSFPARVGSLGLGASTSHAGLFVTWGERVSTMKPREPRAAPPTQLSAGPRPQSNAASGAQSGADQHVAAPAGQDQLQKLYPPRLGSGTSLRASLGPRVYTLERI